MASAQAASAAFRVGPILPSCMLDSVGNSTKPFTLAMAIVTNCRPGQYSPTLYLAFIGTSNAGHKRTVTGSQTGNLRRIITGTVTLRNNIVQSDGAGTHAVFRDSATSPTLISDYNNLVAGNGASVGYSGSDRTALTDWQGATGQDASSISADPLFVDPANGDFHLQSTAGSYHGGLWTADAEDSLCIDAGDPAAGYESEPIPNGRRVNLGAYGGTEQASKSSARRSILLTSPMAGTLLKSSAGIAWTVFGDAWQPEDTITIEWSADGGTTWHPVTGGMSTDADTGVFSWSLIGLEWGDTYRIRLTCDQDPTSTSYSADFSVGGMYYVNDDSLAGDVYCSAVGDDVLNDGKSAAKPKASVQAILDAYDLDPGDTVCRYRRVRGRQYNHSGGCKSWQRFWLCTNRGRGHGEDAHQAADAVALTRNTVCCGSGRRRDRLCLNRAVERDRRPIRHPSPVS